MINVYLFVLLAVAKEVKLPKTFAPSEKEITPISSYEPIVIKIASAAFFACINLELILFIVPDMSMNKMIFLAPETAEEYHGRALGSNSTHCFAEF